MIRNFFTYKSKDVIQYIIVVAVIAITLAYSIPLMQGKIKCSTNGVLKIASHALSVVTLTPIDTTTCTGLYNNTVYTQLPTPNKPTPNGTIAVTKVFTFDESSNQTQTHTVTLPNYHSLTSVKSNTGTVTVTNNTSGTITVSLTNGDPKTSVLTGGSPADTKHIDDWLTQNYSDAQGYVGTLDPFYYSGLAPQTKFVTAQSSSYYSDSEGYSGYLDPYVSSGYLTLADDKIVNKVINNSTPSFASTYYYTEDNGFDGLEPDGVYYGTIPQKGSYYGDPAHSATQYSYPSYSCSYSYSWSGTGWNYTGGSGGVSSYVYYNDGTYQGTLSLTGSGGCSAGTPSGSGTKVGDTTTTYGSIGASYSGTVYSNWLQQYEGTVYRDETDSRTYLYQGEVQTPDARVYHYEGDVTKPDTETYNNTYQYEITVNYLANP